MTLNFASGSFSLHWNRETHENEELMELNKPEQKEQAQDVFFHQMGSQLPLSPYYDQVYLAAKDWE